MLNYAAYPWRLANAGDFDLCGNVKPQGVYHRILWGSDETYIFSNNPANHDKVELIGRYGWREGGNHWTWEGAEGSPIRVEVYSRASEVELLLNGKSYGKVPAGKDHHYTAVFDVTYEPGELVAISYEKGKEVSRDSVKTAGKALSLRITMESDEMAADGISLTYGLVEIVDEEGSYVPTAADSKATATVTGAATLAAFGNGRGATEENYTTGEFTSYEGRWQVILRSTAEAGETKVQVSAEGLGTAEAVVRTKAC
jgi:beta-galactosidase